MIAIPLAVRADLAPSGVLRAGVNYGNFILATRDSATGESRGVAIDLARDVGHRLQVPVSLVAYDTVAHHRTATTRQTAVAAHVPGSTLAKSVLVHHELGYALAVKNLIGAVPLVAKCMGPGLVPLGPCLALAALDDVRAGHFSKRPFPCSSAAAFGG